MCRFCEVSVASCLFGLAEILLLAKSAQSDDGHAGYPSLLAHPARHLVAVHPGQAHIEQHHIGLELSQGLKRSRSRPCVSSVQSSIDRGSPAYPPRGEALPELSQTLFAGEGGTNQEHAPADRRQSQHYRELVPPRDRRENHQRVRRVDSEAERHQDNPQPRPRTSRTAKALADPRRRGENPASHGVAADGPGGPRSLSPCSRASACRPHRHCGSFHRVSGSRSSRRGFPRRRPPDHR